MSEYLDDSITSSTLMDQYMLLTWTQGKTCENTLNDKKNGILLCIVSFYLEIDISRMFGKHSDQVGEALIDGNVERGAHGVVQKVNVCPLAQQQPCNLRLIAKVKHHIKEKNKTKQGLIRHLYGECVVTFQEKRHMCVLSLTQRQCSVMLYLHLHP